MSNKKINYSRHIIYEYDIWDLFSFLTIMFSIICYGIYKYGYHFESFIDEIALSIIIYVLFLTIRYIFLKRTISQYKQIDEQVNNLLIHVKEKINTIENEIDLKQELNHLSNSLSIAIANNGLPIKFDPDSEAINKLFSVGNLIVITEAEPYKWLDPTYIFYLINNAILNLNWVNTSDSKIPLRFATSKSDSSDTIGRSKFQAYENAKKQFIVDLSKIDPNDTNGLNIFFNNLNGTARFMFISDNDLLINKSTIEYLFTIHEMFGCYLYLINVDIYKAYCGLQGKNIIDHYELNQVVKSTNYDLHANGHKVDIGFGLKASNEFEVFQKTRQYLESTQLKDIIKIHLALYLRNLALYLLNGRNYEDERYLFNNYFKKSNSELIPNEKNYFIYFNE